jgi:hypothetical protein
MVESDFKMQKWKTLGKHPENPWIFYGKSYFPWIFHGKSLGDIYMGVYHAPSTVTM